MRLIAEASALILRQCSLDAADRDRSAPADSGSTQGHAGIRLLLRGEKKERKKKKKKKKVRKTLQVTPRSPNGGPREGQPCLVEDIFTRN